MLIFLCMLDELNKHLKEPGLFSSLHKLNDLQMKYVSLLHLEAHFSGESILSITM
jgi:hypothetical protein